MIVAERKKKVYIVVNCYEFFVWEGKNKWFYLSDEIVMYIHNNIRYIHTHVCILLLRWSRYNKLVGDDDRVLKHGKREDIPIYIYVIKGNVVKNGSFLLMKNLE